MDPTPRRSTCVPVTLDGEPHTAFIPQPLPPTSQLCLDQALCALLEQAGHALGRMSGFLAHLPESPLLTHFYSQKEALLSSQMDGAETSFSDLVLREGRQPSGVDVEGAQLVAYYAAALRYGAGRLEDGIPISVVLIQELHQRLSPSLGGDGPSGALRTSHTDVGGAGAASSDYLPPPPAELAELMRNLEQFLQNDGQPAGTLIKAALAQGQFELIRPFTKSNSRMARLLALLVLCEGQLVDDPILCLSAYFKKNSRRYYELLARVRNEGDWEGWFSFFLKAIGYAAEHVTKAAQSISFAVKHDRRLIDKLGRAALSAHRVHQYLQSQPITSAPAVALALGLSETTARAALKYLQDLDVVREMTGMQRNRLFVYHRYFEILSEGAAPLV